MVTSSRFPHFDSGATLVETVLVLPVVLFLVFFSIWLGVTGNNKAAFRDALTNAMHLAVTRSNPLVAGVLSSVGGVPLQTGTLPDIDAWTNQILFTPAGPYATNVHKLLTWDGNAENWSATYANHYLTPGSGGFTPGVMQWVDNSVQDLHNMSPEYIYALVYIYQAMRQSVGNSIKYPCDPNGTSPAPSGCLMCRFGNPAGCVGGAALTSTFMPAHSFPTPATPPPATIAILCDYRPDSAITNITYALVSVMARAVGASPPNVVMHEERCINFTDGFAQ